MQVGDASSQPPWEFTGENGRDTETLDLYRTFARLHLRLFPYEWTYAEQLKTTGRPIQRAVGLVYPELIIWQDTSTCLAQEFAAGGSGGYARRDLAQGAAAAGRLGHYWDGTLYQGGGAATVAAPLSKLPLLCARRSDSAAAATDHRYAVTDSPIPACSRLPRRAGAPLTVTRPDRQLQLLHCMTTAHASASPSAASPCRCSCAPAPSLTAARPWKSRAAEPK